MSNRYSVLWVAHQVHVSTLSGWVFPIQPVMDSRCLSAAGLRFLDLPTPTEEFCRPCGWLTGISLRPHWGYHVPHLGATTGEGALSTPGSWCPLIQGLDCIIHRDLYASLFLTHYYRIHHHPGNHSITKPTRVHSRSPVQSSPCPVPPDGWDFPWALPGASYPVITDSARPGWGPAWTLAGVDKLPLQ